ncbi:MAG: hypothetical protein K2Y71_28840 [Xanthobacteraceae bacterium]|nr:hypothetical protein [Xanthobacteraceae bacterium]
MSQGGAILAKFPGPVMLTVPIWRRLLGLVIGISGTALFVWFWMTPGYYRSYGWIMEPVGIVFFAGLTIRAVILLLFPRHASLTLDAEGFTISHVFHRFRWSWRQVSEFSVETRQVWRYGPHEAVMYAVRDGATGRNAKQKMVPEFYGEPRLHGDALAGLMNEWRRRALALPETSVPIVAQGA